MSVLDAYAIVTALAGEASAAEVEALLRDRHDPPVISAINLTEVIDVSTRILGHPADDVLERIDWLLAGGLGVVAVDEELGRTAGRSRARFYDRRSSALSIADCVCLATALRLGQRLATADPALATTARALGVEVIALPDSRGTRP